MGSYQIKADDLMKNGAISRYTQYHKEIDNNQQVKIKIVEMFREFERLVNQKNQIN